MLSLIKKIESSTVSVKKIIILFATSIVLRGFFENFTNSNVATGLTNLTDIFLHYPLWYVGLFLSIIIILYLFTKQSLLKIANVVAIGSFGILIGPLIDIFVYGFWGHPYNFIQNTYPMLFQHFSTLTFSTHAISLGIKIETVVLIISTGMYVYLRSNKKRSLKAFFAGFLSYVVIFFFLSLPTHTMSIFTTLSGEYITPTTEATVLFYTPPNYKINTTEDLLVLNKKSPEQQYFSQKISIVFTLIILLSLMFLLFIKNKNKFIAILKNIRFLRLFNLYAFAAVGIYFGIHANVYELHSFYTFLNITALSISIAMAWLFSVWENDEADVKIDAVSNPERPMVSHVFNKNEWVWTKSLFLFFALLFSFLVGENAFTSILLFILVYHMYSTKPLRLKKIPIISSALVVLSALLIFIAGFLSFNLNENLSELPFRLLLGIFVIYIIVENIKNMKDIAGDKADKIYTLPVILGNNAGIGMSLLIVVASVFGILYFKFSQPMILITTLFVFGMIYFLNKKPYKETPIFVLYFLLLTGLLLASSVL